MSREEFENGLSDKVLSVALALEVMQLSEESFVGKKPMISIKKETYLDAKRFIDEIEVERSRMLNRQRLLLSSTAIRILEKLSLKSAEKWTTRDIYLSGWSTVPKNSVFVNEVLHLLESLGIINQRQTRRADSFEWCLSDSYTFDDALSVLKGVKY